MPKIKWSDLNDAIHNIKGTLTKITGIEQTCKKIKKEALVELDKLHKVVLEQVNNHKGGSK